jgi:hypothetical protein
MKNKVVKKLVKFLVLFVLFIVAIIASIQGIVKPILYKEYYSIYNEVCKNPGLNSGFIPQGIAVDEYNGKMIVLTSGYMDDDSPSRIYITNEKDRVLVHNAMTIARARIQESIGEPMNGKIIESDDEINKFSKEYTNSVDRLLHYEFETINDTDFLSASAGARFLIASIFQNVNNTIPQYSYITRESSEQDAREYDLYYRYFSDDYEKILYLPELGKNGTTVYYAHWEDEESKCHKEGPYTEDVMFAMAGLSLLEEQRNLGIEANPNIRQLGIQTEVDNRVDDAREELFELRNTYVNSK